MNGTVKKVKMQMVGRDGNAFAIMGRFQKAARRQGWSEKDIGEVLGEATKGDYDHLVATIYSHVDEPQDQGG